MAATLIYHQSGFSGGLSLWGPVFTHLAHSGGDILNSFLSFSANLFINGSAGTSYAVVIEKAIKKEYKNVTLRSLSIERAKRNGLWHKPYFLYFLEENEEIEKMNKGKGRAYEYPDTIFMKILHECVHIRYRQSSII